MLQLVSDGLVIGSVIALVTVVIVGVAAQRGWSGTALLIRARAVAPLLAWRGLANSVVTKASDGGPAVRMPQQNEIAARRVHQLFIPGLDGGALSIEQDYPLDKESSRRGFLYL